MDLVEKIKILNNYLNTKNFNKVIEDGRKILKKIPGNDYLLNLIGMAYQGKSQFSNSIKFFQESLKQNPSNIAAMNNYANSLKALGKLEQSKDLYEKILNINPNYIKAYNNYANLKTSYNDYEGAIDLYKKAINLLKKNEKIEKSHCIEFMFSLAVAYQSYNKVEEAKKVIAEILLINPTHTGAHKLKSSMLRYSKEDPNSMKHLDDMKKLNNIEKLNINEKVDLFFSLGKVFEDLKDFDQAFYYLKEANKLRFEKFGSNLENEKKLFHHIIKIFDKINLEESNKDIPSKKIIFICGMPRSGTTLLEQIIASHSEVYGAGELVYLQQVIKKNFFKDQKLDKQKIIENKSSLKNIISSEYLDHFNIYDINKNIITDKAPQNFRWLGFIKLFFPNSKIIHCYRNPRDNCLSIFKNSFASSMMNWSNNSKDIANYYNLYLHIMSFWKTKISKFILDVEYEKLVENKEDEIKRLLKFCDLPWDEKCLNPEKNSKTPIKTVSVSQARQPIYKSSLNSNINFDKHLNEMFSILK